MAIISNQLKIKGVNNRHDQLYLAFIDQILDFNYALNERHCESQRGQNGKSRLISDFPNMFQLVKISIKSS
jgi:hypothetical protein